MRYLKIMNYDTLEEAKIKILGDIEMVNKQLQELVSQAEKTD